MSVLTIASSKGGSGKITVSMRLAGRLAADGPKVVALDADPTGALVRWAQNTYEGPSFTAVAEADETRFAHLIDAESVSADLVADLVLVDTAGFGNRAATVAMTNADAVLFRPSQERRTLLRAEKTVKLVQGLARAVRRDTPAKLLLNRVKRTQLSRHAVREIENAGLPLLTASLSDLLAHGEMTFSGRTP